jgi:hypothetical protein
MLLPKKAFVQVGKEAGPTGPPDTLMQKLIVYEVPGMDADMSWHPGPAALAAL